MRVKSGWARIFDPRKREVVARGYVYVVDPPLPCPPEGDWEGEVHLIRGHEQLRPGAGLWLLQFDTGVQQRWVEVDSVEDAWEPSGKRGMAFVSSRDERYPSHVVELGGDG